MRRPCYQTPLGKNLPTKTRNSSRAGLLRHFSLARWTLITLALSCVFSAAAVADSPSRREPPGYKSAVNAGIDEFDRGNFNEAREHFTRAHALFPNARTLRGLGMSEFELRSYVEAVEKLEAALASNDKRLEGKLRDDTTALLARARAYVGEVQFRLSPDSTEVRVDGFQVTLGLERKVRLAVGDHVLEFSAQGHTSDRRAITVLGEQTLNLDIALTIPEPPKPDLQVQAAPVAPLRHDAPVEKPTPVYKRWWLWTTVGVVVAGGVAAGVLLSMRGTETRDPNGGSTGDTLFVK